MNTRLFRTTLGMVLLLLAHAAYAQKQLVVVANRNINYEDPRFERTGTLERGEAITVSDNGSTYGWWIYPMEPTIDFAKRNFHVPGTVQGELCIVVNGSNVRFRESPSLNAGIYCVDIMSGASYFQKGFIKDSQVKREYRDSEGILRCWDPIYLPKGTRLPYKGKVGEFYKTAFDGYTLYISAKYSYVK